MPTVTFSTIAELIIYVDQYIKVNHNNEITGEQHNNVENGLAQFIISSPRNYNRAYVTGAAAAFVATSIQCVLVFKSGATGSIQLTDNKWNEWIIYNNSGANKTLVGSIASYKTINGVTRNYVPSETILNIAKGNDNIWYESGGGGGSVTIDPYQFEIGEVDSPMVAGDTEIILPAAKPNSEVITLDGAFLYTNRNDRISYTIVFTATETTITFNQGVVDGQLYSIKTILL